MPVRTILSASQHREELSQVSTEFSEAEEVPFPLIQDLKDTCQSYKGYGLAAPQIGFNRRIFIMNTPNHPMMVCINPKIIKAEVKLRMKEGCLSFPGAFTEKKRKAWLEVEFTNEKLERVSEVLIGVDALCFQHELDHLDGILLDSEGDI